MATTVVVCLCEPHYTNHAKVINHINQLINQLLSHSFFSLLSVMASQQTLPSSSRDLHRTTEYILLLWCLLSIHCGAVQLRQGLNRSCMPERMAHGSRGITLFKRLVITNSTVWRKPSNSHPWHFGAVRMSWHFYASATLWHFYASAMSLPCWAIAMSYQFRTACMPWNLWAVNTYSFIPS